MAQVDKIKVGDTTYDISASPDATNTFTSADTTTSQANTWTETAPMTSGETNSSTMNKTSSMFKNVRYLYNSLGSGVSPSNTVASQLEGKAPKVHSHSINDIPHSDIVENTTTTVPTSAVVYEMNETLKSLNDASMIGYKNLVEGNIKSGVVVDILFNGKVVKNVTGTYKQKPFIAFSLKGSIDGHGKLHKINFEQKSNGSFTCSGNRITANNPGNYTVFLQYSTAVYSRKQAAMQSIKITNSRGQSLIAAITDLDTELSSVIVQSDMYVDTLTVSENVNGAPGDDRLCGITVTIV